MSLLLLQHDLPASLFRPLHNSVASIKKPLATHATTKQRTAPALLSDIKALLLLLLQHSSYTGVPAFAVGQQLIPAASRPHVDGL